MSLKVHFIIVIKWTDGLKAHNSDRRVVIRSFWPILSLDRQRMNWSYYSTDGTDTGQRNISEEWHTVTASYIITFSLCIRRSLQFITMLAFSFMIGNTLLDPNSQCFNRFRSKYISVICINNKYSSRQAVVSLSF